MSMKSLCSSLSISREFSKKVCMKSDLHVAHDIAVIGSKGRIVEAQVGKVALTRVDITFIHRQVVSYVHPMSLNYSHSHTQIST